MKKVFTPTLILAGLLAAGTAVADTPYAYWDASRTTDVAVADSFNRTSSSAYSEDNDVALDIRSRSSVQEDNDVTSTRTHQEDNDYSSVYRTSEDNDYSSVYTSSEDNDVSEDNDITEIVDFQISTPTLTGYKYQDQHAGHQADQSVLGAARGHEVGVSGGPTVVSAGNDEQVFYGPAMVNNNTNQLPQNNLFVQGSNGAPISQSNTFAGRDMGPKGVFAPIGNTSATVFGDTSQRSGAVLGQSGDSANSIADQMNSAIRK
jgi:hypothetical protein